MVDLNAENYRKNAELLLEGIWYSGLPDLLDIHELMQGIDNVFSMINKGTVREFTQESDGFIVSWNYITSPPYVRSPGVEALTYFDFKKNRSLREMQIPNLLHYISFMYNTLIAFEPLFEKLYLANENSKYVENSNSYLVFADLFEIYNYDELVDWGVGGTFTTKNNKANSSVVFSENKRRMLDAENAYLYSLKMDIESFFPSLYTHNFEKIGNRLPFSSLSCDLRYYSFLDSFHQRINNNQTKGVPAGIFSSHIAAELCMLCVDEEIRRYIEKQKYDISFIRYVDDIVFFSDSESELKTLFPAVQSILNDYRLRINGNKTEAIHSVLSIQPSYIAELERIFPILASNNEESQDLTLPMFFEVRKYIGDCLSTGRSSQVRTMISIVFKRISDNQLNTSDLADQLFFFFLRLAFEDQTLVSHIFRLLDLLLSNADEKGKMLYALEKKRDLIDTEYPDTTFQIWYYFILFRHSDDSSRLCLINSIQGKKYNPLVIASMVLPGKKNNLKLFNYIRSTYVMESGSQQWKNEIMYSKWWLPLFKIFRYDSHNYCNFMKSENFPLVLRAFPLHVDSPVNNE